MIRHHSIFLVLLFCFLASLEVCAVDQPQFAVKETHRDVNGVTFRTASGTMQIEVCGDRVIHVVASPTSEIPTPKVPIVTQPCRAKNVQIKAGPKNVKISTPVITATVDTASGAVSFVSADGKLVLGEPQPGGKAFDVPSVFEAKTWQVQQTFLSPADEALYGLGQHQEGIFNVRGIPIRLSQANTNISIPVVLSSNGYGILWNNPSLTDFNPADESIAIDPSTGKGTFTTGAKGVYGFVLSSDNRKQLVLEVNGQRVIDLENEWTPSSASGSVDLEGNKEYEVLAHG
ncbi:MAG TPA: hypothetical protein VGN39_19085, partial [Terriglobales bacterium]|nr:hypothetical protein [Terriglobales bacterium]